MPRKPRVDIGNEYYHVLNRANARLRIFFKKKDYSMFEKILLEAKDKFSMRIIAYCLMPNHFHLLLHPRNDGDMQKFMQWVTLTHTQLWHREHNTVGTGHLYQGRYKSFLIQNDTHLLAEILYIENNPVKAALVKNITDWEFSSARHRLGAANLLLSEPPIDLPKNYLNSNNSTTI